MEVAEIHNAAEFLKKAEGFLMEHEAENNLVLGQAMRLARGETAGTVAVIFYVVEDEGRVLVAGMHNQPYRLVLSRGPGPAIARIADWAARKKAELAGVSGRPGWGTRFRRAGAGDCDDRGLGSTEESGAGGGDRDSGVGDDVHAGVEQVVARQDQGRASAADLSARAASAGSGGVGQV